MFRVSSSLYNRPIMSLRSGTSIGTALEPVINPHNLQVLGWWCRAIGSNGRLILLAEDVRDSTSKGLAVNDESALSMPSDLVRHHEILEIQWKPIGKLVKSKHRKLGKVSDYSYDEDSLFIQKLYVTRSLVKVFTNDDTLLIDRQQVVEVTDDYILVEDADVKVKAEETVAADAVPAG